MACAALISVFDISNSRITILYRLYLHGSNTIMLVTDSTRLLPKVDRINRDMALAIGCAGDEALSAGVIGNPKHPSSNLVVSMPNNWRCNFGGSQES